MSESQNIEYVKCNLCEEDKTESFFNENGYSLVRCKTCGLVYVNPRPLNYAHKAEEINDDRYNSYIREYIEHKSGHTIRSKEILNEILRLKPSKGKLLEIGCAAGFFLDTAKEMGWQVEGVEPEVSNARYAIDKLNLEINISPMESAQFPENHFDIIVAFNVLSHLKDPKEFFNKIHSILKNGGVFVFETGNKGEMKSKKQGEILSESWLTPEHLYHFTEESLALLIKKADFKVISRSKTHAVDHLLSKSVLSLDRSNRKKWILKRLLTKFDGMRVTLALVLKYYFISILKADVSSLLYIVEKD